MSTITVLLADDHKIMRAGLRSILEKSAKVSVVAEAEDGRQAVKLASQFRPDLVIMDISMPKLNGIEATRQIMADLPETKIIALSMHSDKRFLVEMYQAGAVGYLLKDCAAEELEQAVRTVAGNKRYLSPEIAGVLLDDYMDRFQSKPADTALALSTREREVLQLIAEGWSTKNIADHLYISIKTAESHRRKIMKKLDLHSVADLTKYAVREGLTSLNL
ncbi:MAG: response regulator transcription factor [Proteobacteria bacterium]|nr:response regulator transcription factor [Pseudomonadota bacterium]MBU1739474.1 response regulator transcription factor [Pseudomonadota bacterium]